MFAGAFSENSPKQAVRACVTCFPAAVATTSNETHQWFGFGVLHNHIDADATSWYSRLPSSPTLTLRLLNGEVLSVQARQEQLVAAIKRQIWA
eukprot:3176278-Amphidinium_carterae.1